MLNMTSPEPVFPTADQVATAIVAASRLVGADPIKVATGAKSKPGAPIPESRARPIATEALWMRFPRASKQGIARCCAWPSYIQACSSLSAARRSKWWSDDLVDEVVGALIPDEDTDEDASPGKGRAEPVGPLDDCAYCGTRTRTTLVGLAKKDGDMVRQKVRCGCPKGRTWARTTVTGGA